MGKVRIYAASYEAMDETIERIFGDFDLPVTGQAVLVKPNILGPFPPERHITTHPSVIRSLVKKLDEEGARVTVGDNPGMGGYGINMKCARASGILDASNGHYRNISAESTSIRVHSRRPYKTVISREVLEADYLITVPKFKTHLLTTLTGAVKNSYGFLVGGEKGNLHRAAKNSDEFAELVVDVYELRPPDFVVMDAVVAMQGVGPSSKDLRPDVGKILAGENSVEVDAVMATMMGLAPEEVPILRIAHERGLGEIDLGKIDLDRPVTPIPKFKCPESRTGGALESFITRLGARVLTKRPVVDRKSCTRCGVCARQCPVGAIMMTPYPRIRGRACISCFCCIEFCQQGAMTVAPVIRFLRRWI